MTLTEELHSLLAPLQVGEEKYAVHAVDALLDLAIRRQASDLHLIPDEESNWIIPCFRIDGVLEPADRIEGGINIVTRLKVIANLLTYRTDVPQEGRVKGESTKSEIRVSTFPTVHGEKAVVRFFVGSGEYQTLEELGYASEIDQSIRRFLDQTSGLLLTCGPAGSGKTTMLYAALRHILENSVSPRSICTLEDPVEAILSGISQSAIKPESDFNYERGLISLMRQDPDVIMVGEIRDQQTAGIVFQASLTGHLVLSTFHAGTATAALGRLADMNIEPYILRSGLSAVLAQRLLRKSCSCREANSKGCPLCRMTGYCGRVVVAEMLQIEQPEIANAILQKRDVQSLERAALSSGMVPMLKQAQQMIKDGLTTTEECHRVFGADSLKC